MARDTTLPLTKNQWTMLTASAVAVVSFQNLSGRIIKIAVTADTNAPTDELTSWEYDHREGETDIALSSLLSTVTSGNVWAKCDQDGGRVRVTHG